MQLYWPLLISLHVFFFFFLRDRYNLGAQTPQTDTIHSTDIIYSYILQQLVHQEPVSSSSSNEEEEAETMRLVARLQAQDDLESQAEEEQAQRETERLLRQQEFQERQMVAAALHDTDPDEFPELGSKGTFLLCLYTIIKFDLYL
jgi:tellurite resistance protein